MKEKYSLHRYVIELTYIDKLNKCKWWQFSKKKEADMWRKEQLNRNIHLKNNF
jgi:hypothetical protein